MLLTVEQADLLSAVSAAARAVPTRSPIPVLGGLLLEAREGALTATGRDGPFSIRRAVPAQVVQPGAVVLPARAVVEIARRFGSGPIRIEGDARSATFSWQRSRLTLRGMEAKLYPAPARDEEGETVTVSTLDFEDLVRRTTFAISHDESRPILMGVELSFDGQTLRAIATDGFRIACVEREGLGLVPAGKSLVLDGRALAEAGRLVASSGEDAASITFGAEGKTVTIQAGNTWVTAQVLEGSYPKVLDLVPQEYPHRVIVPRREFLGAIERAMLVTGDGAPVVLEPDGDRLVVRAAEADRGEAREELPAQIAGDPVVIAFKSRYLIEGLRLMAEDEVELGLIEPLKAARLRGVGSAGFTYIVLPVKLRQAQAA